MEVEHPPSRVGNPEGLRNSKWGPHIDDITMDIEMIKLPMFVRGRANECAKAWLEGITRCFELRDYTSNS